MPSPLGHALAGIAAAWTADLIPGPRGWRTAGSTAPFFQRAGGALTVVCAVLAVAPDGDLVLATHRSMTHSITAAILTTIVAAGVTGWVTRSGRGARGRQRLPVARVALMCGAAYGSHLVLDWLATDMTPPFGLQILWPFSLQWFISGLDVFPQTERRRLLSAASLRTNFIAFAWETTLLLPVVGLLWLVRVKALARFAAELAGRDHAA